MRLSLYIACLLATLALTLRNIQADEVWPDSLLLTEIGEFELPDGPAGSGSPPIAPHQRAVLSTDALEVVAGNNRFALEIYQRLLAQSDENLLVSPFSISTALAMTYAGARGRTAEQMAEVLGFTLPGERLHASFGELLTDLIAPREGYQFNVANRLFGQSGFPFQQSFVNTTGTHYSAPVQPLDFVVDPEASRKTINQWVSDRTNARIPELLAGGTVTSDTRLVLTNAIYFDGKWKQQFNKQATQNKPFFKANGTQSQVPMMSQQRSLRYAEQPGFQILEMPYAGDDLAMVIMLPTERDGLASLERSLTNELWKENLASLRETTVNVSMPKFTFDSAFTLKDQLIAMGMVDAFGDADFSGMVTGGGLKFDDVIHKAFIAVNEEGTEAAAATAVTIRGTNQAYHPYVEPKNFLADHPFLFALQDLHSGELLFLGRVTDPGSLAVPVPEPATAALMLSAGLCAGLCYRSKANRTRRAT